ncbi:MAG: ribosome maturation factor RimP [Oscillibacter sp.]
MKKITELTAELAAPAIAEQGCTLWDVEYVKEAGTWYLRILLDKEGGVDILDCEEISRKVSDLLDEADPIEGSYTLRWLRRCRAGAEAALRFSVVSGQPRAGEAVPGPGGPEGVCRLSEGL